MTSEPSFYFDSWTFTFDNWIIAYALCNLFQVTQEVCYLNQAEKIAHFLLKNTLGKDGLFSPIFDVATNKTKAPNDKWSRQAGSFHAKALLALSQLYRITRKDHYRGCAIKLAKMVASLQEKDGRFITQNSNRSTLLHPHFYTLEGLLSFGWTQNDVKLISIVEKGFKWVLDNQTEDGTIFCFFQEGNFFPYVRVDVLAQALRIGTILLQIGSSLQNLEDRLNRLRSQLLSYQVKNGSQAGGFLYGQEENGVIHHHVNAWVTMFSAQALWLHDQLQSSNYKYQFDFFV